MAQRNTRAEVEGGSVEPGGASRLNMLDMERGPMSGRVSSIETSAIRAHIVQ